MPSRKRGIDEVDQSEADPAPSLLHQVRNCWQFASLMQYIHIFGDAAKISEDVDVDVRSVHPSRFWSRLLGVANTMLSVDARRRMSQGAILGQTCRDWPLHAADGLVSSRLDVCANSH